MYVSLVDAGPRGDDQVLGHECPGADELARVPGGDGGHPAVEHGAGHPTPGDPALRIIKPVASSFLFQHVRDTFSPGFLSFIFSKYPGIYEEGQNVFAGGFSVGILNILTTFNPTHFFFWLVKSRSW